MISRLYLPKLESPPATILEHLVAKFPQVDAARWSSRVERGLVTLDDGTTVDRDSPYRHGLTVHYFRENPAEPAALENETILYRDDEILVVDKPHGMPVTPAGDYVERSLLVRLQKSTGVETLSPAHRLDRDTAGLVLFVVKPASRAVYQQLFARGEVEREYLAVARIGDSISAGTSWQVSNRLAPGEPWYKQQIVEGTPNSHTDIELVESFDGFGLFRIQPRTGKTHQIRVHMASLGFPILGDPVYGDGPGPLQLIAHRLAFGGRSFTSTRRLSPSSR